VQTNANTRSKETHKQVFFEQAKMNYINTDNTQTSCF